MRPASIACAVVALAIAAFGCARHDEPLALASDTTRGVYDANYDATTAHFDAALKLQVTKPTLSDLAGKMHALGAYRGLRQVGSDPAKGRYDFEATFDKGAMMVEMRLDPQGLIGAYRVVPEVGSTAAR